MREVFDREQRVERIEHRPWPQEAHRHIGDRQQRQHQQDEATEPPPCFPPAARVRIVDEEQQHRRQHVERADQRENARAGSNAEGEANADDDGTRRLRIVFERMHQSEQQERHRHRERRVLRVHEHMPVEQRQGGEQQGGEETGGGTAEPPPQPPGRGDAGDADQPADQPPGLEQVERQDLGGERGQHVEAAAIHVEIDERQRALVAESGAVQRQQQVAVLRVGVIVPAEAVIAKGQARRDHQHCQQREREAIENGTGRPKAGRSRERRWSGSHHHRALIIGRGA